MKRAKTIVLALAMCAGLNGTAWAQPQGGGTAISSQIIAAVPDMGVIARIATAAVVIATIVTATATTAGAASAATETGMMFVTATTVTASMAGTAMGADS